jgi:hypothetical protein
MCLRTSLHFTPDGVSRTRAVITINMALLTEDQTTDHRLQSSDPFTISPTLITPFLVSVIKSGICQSV